MRNFDNFNFLRGFQPIVTSSPPTFRIAVLISGGGTTLRNLIEKIRAGRLRRRNRAGHFQQRRGGRLHYATEAGIPAAVIEPGKFADRRLQPRHLRALPPGRGRSGRHGRLFEATSPFPTISPIA